MNLLQPKPVSLPEDSLLRRYSSKPGHYTDCYEAIIDGRSDFQSYVFAFYTTWLFRCERLILKWAVQRPSSDQDVRQLAEGKSNTFAAWSVEARARDEILLCDLAGRTRSWLKTEDLPDSKTRLLFGSAVVPVSPSDAKPPRMGFLFQALLGFHKLYSRALLASAARTIKSGE